MSNMETAAKITQFKKANTGQKKTKDQETMPNSCFSVTKKQSGSSFGRSSDARNKSARAQKSRNGETSTLRNACQPRGTVDIRPFKAFVLANYPKDSAVYDVVVTDQDFLDAAEFSAKVGVWLKLSRRIKN